MEDNRFDSLARVVFAGRKTSRRATLAAVLGAALLRSDPDAALARKNKKARVTAQAADRCFPGTRCAPGPGRNTSRCDFALSAVFRNKDVRGSNLSKSSFAGADLRGADFRGANLTGGCFIGANLTGAKVGGANLGGAIFCNTVMPDGAVNDSGCEGATPCCHLRVQDCPDANVSCWQTNEIGECGAFVGNLGPFGHCWHLLSGCCPCGHLDQAYWTEQCNTHFPACNGRCIAQDEEQFAACFTCP